MTDALQVEDIHSYYGKSRIIRGLSLRIDAGEIVTRLGRNGAGKLTTLRPIAGLVMPRRGKITVYRQDMPGWPAHKSAPNGLALVSESRGIFHLLTVEGNLRISQRKVSHWSP